MSKNLNISLVIIIIFIFSLVSCQKKTEKPQLQLKYEVNKVWISHTPTQQFLTFFPGSKSFAIYEDTLKIYNVDNGSVRTYRFNTGMGAVSFSNHNRIYIASIISNPISNLPNDETERIRLIELDIKTGTYMNDYIIGNIYQRKIIEI